MFSSIVKGLLIQQLAVNMMELYERHSVFRYARDYADSTGKPLLVVGGPKWSFSHSCGDTTIDIDPNLNSVCDYEVADIRAIPYPDGYFGAAYASHVLEHLPTLADGEKALRELHRVADKVFIVSPHKTSIIAWLHPDHHLWVKHAGDTIVLEQRGRAAESEEPYLISMEIC